MSMQSPRILINQQPADERKSMLSISSGGSSTLMDSISQKQRRQKMYTTAATSQAQQRQQQNLRKFTSAISKPGQARETREAISRVLSAVNSMRTPPIAEPIDYEKFISEKSAQLENDRDRDLLLFFRDDISGVEIYPRERTAIPSVSQREIDEADWLLPKEALKFYTSPYVVINFNYAKFAGEFKKFDPSQNLNYLRFESDMIYDEEKSQFTEQNMANEILREGNLMVLPGDSIVDSFKSEKKRYCILRRTDDGKIYIEVYKQATQQQLFTPMEIKAAQIKGTKKGKTLQISSTDSDKRTLILSAENESDLQFWLFEIDRAITWKNRDIIAADENTSLNSSIRENSFPPSQDSESVASEDSTGSRDSLTVWRGKNAAAKALRPPIVERNNIFSLYWDMEPLPEPDGHVRTLTEPLNEIHTANAKEIQQIPALIAGQKPPKPKTSVSMISAISDDDSFVENRSISPDTSDFIGEKPAILFTAQIRQLDIKTRFACRETCEQIEPFFLRLFIFDASLGTRISEEFHIEIPTQRFNELRNNNAIITSKQILPERIHGISRHRIQNAQKLICTIQNPRPDLYLVVFIERILSDIPTEIYMKTNSAIDAKASVKIQKSIAASFLRLNHLRTLFAWTATPIFPSLCINRTFSTPNTNIRTCPVYKFEGKLIDADLQKMLNDMQKPEKIAKWITFPSAGLTLEADVTSVLCQIPMRISPSFYPLRPWRVPSPESAPLSPSFELQSFADRNVEPLRGCTNLLYVYPIALNYSTQKTFTKARNIACTIRFIQSKSRQFEPHYIRTHPIYKRTDLNGPLVQSFTSSVQYHEQNPCFNEEIKIQLPPSLDQTDHLLFSFSHISVANALSSKQSGTNENYETPIGYSWLPLTRDNKYGLPHLALSENVQEFDLPVSANLPTNYIHAYAILGKEGSTNYSNPEIKLVEGGKHLFRVRLRLISSLFTTEERIQNFFQLCQFAYHSVEKSSSLNDTRSVDSSAITKSGKTIYHNENACSASDLQEDLSPTHEQSLNFEQELINIVEQLTEVNIDRIIPFFEVIFNRLFNLLTISKTQELAITVLSVIVNLVDCIYMSRKSKREMLINYIRLHFNSSIGSQNADTETLHGAICKFIPIIFHRARENGSAQLQKLFRQLWFLLDCASKSMAHWLILSNLIKSTRTYRFPNELYFALEELFQCLAQQITEKYNEFPAETREANLALSNFINYCLSLMDRYQVMKELYGVVKRIDSVDSRKFRIYKFELLQMLTGHEHWIPLCLPLLTDKYGTVMRADTIIFEGFPHNQAQAKNSSASGGFFSKLFSHIFSPPYAPHESNEIERFSASYSEHFYLSNTFCSVHFLAGLLFQEMTNSLKESREYRRKIIRLIRNMLVKHYKDQRYGDTSAKNRIAILYLPILRLVIENVREIEATFKGSVDSPMHSPLPGVKANNINNGKYSSLTSQTADNMKTKLGITPSNDSMINDNRATSTSSLCRNALTTSSYNSHSTITKESVKTAPEKSNNTLVVLLAEKLDKSEVRDLLLSSLYILNNVPKKILAAFWNAQDSIAIHTQITPRSSIRQDSNAADELPDSSANQQQSQNLALDFIRFLELSLLCFRYRGRSYHIMQQAKRAKSKGVITFDSTAFDSSYKSFGTGGQFSTLTDFADSIGQSADDDSKKESTSYLMDCHLAQEVALIVLETIQTISNQVAAKTKFTSSKYYDTIFIRLLNLELELLHENWPENVRLQTLAALAVFVNLFSSRFFHSGPLDCLSTLVKALLLQLNSRIARIQTSAAALIQLILKGGFDASTTFSSKLASSADLNSMAERKQSKYSAFITEKLGRPGAQISVALARLLSEKNLDSYRFERGLTKIESLVAGDKQNTSSPFVVTSLFERAVLELVKQLRGVLEATQAITGMANNPIQLADLHIQLANSYRGSAALRSEFFDALANTHISEGWYSEGAVCQAHSLAIVGKELQAKNMLTADWSLFNVLNETIVTEEGMRENNMGSTQQGGFTLEDFTRKVEQLIRTLILSERYEAIGPIYRLSIPIFEKQLDFKAMVSIYAELQQSCSRAAEIKLNGKRHLGSYFKIKFYGQNHFYEEHKTEWVYREPRLTSLAEACDRMVESVRLALGHEQVRILNERMDDQQGEQLDPNIAFIQVAYVEPCQSEDILHKLNNNNGNDGGNSEEKLLEKINDPMNYGTHTNIRTFIQEEKLMDQKVPEKEPEMARTALKRLILTVENPFPNTRRRQRIVRTDEIILSPLDLACECLLFKAAQIRRILAAADIPKTHFGVYDKEMLKRLDLKQLQLFLQGSVSPTVNAGLLAYAEAFTASAQKQRYGQTGINRLIGAFKTLISELDDALRVNEAAMGGERAEYQGMLRQSFDGMLERLSMFFEGEKFIQRAGGDEKANGVAVDAISLGLLGNINGTGAEMHIFDTISGLNG